MEGRRKTAQMQEASERLAAAEAEVKKTTEAAAPLAGKDAEDLSAESASKVCEELAGLEKAAQSKLDDARKFIAERAKEVKDNKALSDMLKKLQARLSNT